MNFFPHQIKSLNDTEQFNRVAYYLDMGLGKTFVGAEKLYKLNNAVNLVICQKSKIDDWVQHFKEYYPDISIYDLTKPNIYECFVDDLIVYPNKDRKIGRKTVIYGTNVAIINYELVWRRKALSSMVDFTLMLDESSLISNEGTQRAKFILKLKPESVILLSGTPTAGKYERLWSQVQLLGWKISKKAFWKSYIETMWIDVGGFQREVVTGYKNVEHLKKKLTEYGAVFMKTNEVMELPEQIEQKIMVSQTNEYKYFVKNSYLMIDTEKMIKCGDDNASTVVELIGDNSLTRVLHKRQLCGQYHKEKLQALLELIESTEDRVIIFYNFTEELHQMQKQLAELKRPYSILNGSIKDLNAYENATDSITFIQYQAGAMGGNFQKANKIIYYTLPLGKGSCDLWEQSKKRIHRIGQNKTCFYYYLLVKGSFEEQNLEALKEGRDYTDELFKKS